MKLPCRESIIALALMALCQPDALAQASAEQKHKDLAQLHRLLVDHHPGVDRYVSLSSLHASFNNLDHAIRAGSNWDFYQVALRLVAEVRCGHTRLRPSTAMNTSLPERIYFPLPISFVRQKMYARFPDKAIRQVTTINGDRVSEIIKQIFRCMPVDGFADSAKYEFVASSFALWYARVIRRQTGNFVLTDGDGKTFNIDAVDLHTVSSVSFSDRGEGHPIQFNMKGKTGYLRVQTFSSEECRQSGMDYKQFLDRTFSTLKTSGTQSLVVDIRDNGGGDDQYGAWLCSYLLSGSFRYFKTVKEKEGDAFVPVNHPCLSVQQPSPHRFGGSIVLLVNGRTFSTAADVGAVFKASGRGVVMGSETGGGYEGNTSGRSETFTLTNTGLTITIPQWYYENEVKPQPYPHRGVIPDVVPPISAMSPINGKDEVLEYALAYKVK